MGETSTLVESDGDSGGQTARGLDVFFVRKIQCILVKTKRHTMKQVLFYVCRIFGFSAQICGHGSPI